MVLLILAQDGDLHLEPGLANPRHYSVNFHLRDRRWRVGPFFVFCRRLSDVNRIYHAIKYL